MATLIGPGTAASAEVLNAISRIPTKSLSAVVDHSFFKTLSDADFMRIAVYRAEKSYEEGGCPIGAVIIDNDSRAIVGKGHNTLVQENDPYITAKRQP
jgi:creatinine deaminase